MPNETSLPMASSAMEQTPKGNGHNKEAFPLHSEKERPEMPDRGEFVTAEEIRS